MLDTYIKNRGMSKTIIHNNNHNDISELNWDADYDGKVANVSLDLLNNGEKGHFNITLTNDDLANLLTIPSVNKPLEQRLSQDFRIRGIEETPLNEHLFIELRKKHVKKPKTLKKLKFKKTTPHSKKYFTHISSPKSYEKFVIPSVNKANKNINKSSQPVYKVIRNPSSRRRKSKSITRRNSNKNKINKYLDSLF